MTFLQIQILQLNYLVKIIIPLQISLFFSMCVDYIFIQGDNDTSYPTLNIH